MGGNSMYVVHLGINLPLILDRFHSTRISTTIYNEKNVSARTYHSTFITRFFSPSLVAKNSSLVVTAVSPNVVVTVLLRLKEERLGMNKGIHTLIIAMTSCNDVLAIFLFGVILGVIFSTGEYG